MNNTGTKKDSIMKQTAFWREKTESIEHVQNIQYLYLLNKYTKCNVWRLAVRYDPGVKRLNGLVRFAERRNLFSARVPSYFNWPLPRPRPFTLGGGGPLSVPIKYKAVGHRTAGQDTPEERRMSFRRLESKDDSPVVHPVALTVNRLNCHCSYSYKTLLGPGTLIPFLPNTRTELL